MRSTILTKACGAIFILCVVSYVAAEKDSTQASPPKRSGISRMMDSLSKAGPPPGLLDAVGSAPNSMTELTDSSKGLRLAPPRLNGIVKNEFFSIIPKAPIASQKEAAYKGVLEEARQEMAYAYSQAIDTTRRLSWYHGDVKLKVMLDDTGGVASCTIDDFSAREPGVRMLAQKSVAALNFKPVHENPAIKGFIVRFSFYPMKNKE